MLRVQQGLGKVLSVCTQYFIPGIIWGVLYGAYMIGISLWTLTVLAEKMTQDITVIHEAVKNIGAANDEVRTSGLSS